MLEKHLQDDPYFAFGSFNRNRAIRAAGKEAQFLERVEALLRQ